MNKTARENFGFELERVTNSDETFKRKKQTQLVDDRLHTGNGYSIISKKGSDVAKQINADLLGIDGADRQLDQTSGMQ